LELPRRDAEGALEVPGELTLVREADVRGDLRQGEVGPPLQELAGPLDAARDDELVRRQPGGRLELPREVIGAQTGDRGRTRLGPAPRAGQLIALVCATSWLLGDVTTNLPHSHRVFLFINFVIRSVFFLTFVSLFDYLRRVVVEVRGLAATDALTKVLNRRSFYEAATAHGT
jgi:hypothetical protein